MDRRHDRTVDVTAGRRLLSILVSVACVAAVVLALLTATSTLTPAIAFAQTGHWVVNTADRTVVHVDGGTSQVDARVDLPADAGEPLFALQGERQGFVVSRDRVAVFGRSTLTVDTTIPVEFDEVPVGIETVGGPYLVYRSVGTIVRLGVPPLSLPIGGPVARPVWTDDGTVWMHRPDNGSFCAMRAGADALDCSVAAPDEPGGLTVTGDLPAFVATRQDEAQVLAAFLGVPVALGADVAETGLLADRDTEGRLAVVEPDADRMVLTDSAGVPTGRNGGAAIPVDLGPGEFSSPVASNGVIAVLDLEARRLLTFDTSGRPLASVDLPPGAEPTLTRGGDGRIYADDGDGATTHVIGADGSVTSVATGGVLPESVAIAAPPQRRSPVAPPPTLRQRLDTPGPGQVSPVFNGPVGPGPRVPPLPNPIAPPQPVVVQPPAPTGVTAQVQGDSVVVNWQPVGGRGQPVTYVVRANGGDPKSATGTTVTYSGVAPGTPFTYRVRSIVNGVESADSAPSRSVLIVGRPGPPANLAARQVRPGDHVVVEWAVSWSEPDLRGGEFVRYLVDQGDSDRSSPTTTSRNFTFDECTVHRVAVQAVTRGTNGEDVIGDRASINVGADRDCTIDGQFRAGVTQDGRTVEIFREFEASGFASAPCTATFNGVERWSGTCKADQHSGVRLTTVELDYDTTYDVVITIEPPTPASRRTVAGPVTVTTGSPPVEATAPDCTTDPLPAGC